VLKQPSKDCKACMPGCVSEQRPIIALLPLLQAKSLHYATCIIEQ